MGQTWEEIRLLDIIVLAFSTVIFSLFFVVVLEREKRATRAKLSARGDETFKWLFNSIAFGKAV